MFHVKHIAMIEKEKAIYLTKTYNNTYISITSYIFFSMYDYYCNS